MKPSRQFLPLCLAAAALCARGAVPVTARDGAFFEGDAPVRLSCADGVALPEPSEAEAAAEDAEAAAEDAEKLLAVMRATEEGRDAAVIGRVTEKHPGKVVMKTAFGGSRILQKLAGAQLPRIC